MAPHPAGVHYLLVWHSEVQTEAEQMSAVATGLRMALLTTGQAFQVVHVAPDLAQVTAVH